MYKNKRMAEGSITGEFIRFGNISDECHISVGSIPTDQLHVEYQNMSEMRAAGDRMVSAVSNENHESEDRVVKKGGHYGKTTE